MSTTLYNEIEPFAADWMENLERAGHIAPGRVERRSIVDLQPADVAGTGQRHFFAGIGGWSRALRLAGVPDSASIWTGSCPCQPFSSAGKRKGTSDERHLWPEWFRLIRACRPGIIFGEQVAAALRRDRGAVEGALSWFELVQRDLESEGYAIGAAVLGAHSVEAPHIRQRLYFVAHADERAGGQGRALGAGSDHQGGALEGAGPRGGGGTGLVGDPDKQGPQGRGCKPEQRAGERTPRPASTSFWSDIEWLACLDGKQRPTQPGLFPLAHGVPARVGRLRGYGNAIVPQVAAAFVRAAFDTCT